MGQSGALPHGCLSGQTNYSSPGGVITSDDTPDFTLGRAGDGGNYSLSAGPEEHCGGGAGVKRQDQSAEAGEEAFSPAKGLKSVLESKISIFSARLSELTTR